MGRLTVDEILVEIDELMQRKRNTLNREFGVHPNIEKDATVGFLTLEDLKAVILRERDGCTCKKEAVTLEAVKEGGDEE